ncbi:DNA-binding SARP family transcriptional activator [Stackebrandtia endophytica]|uniref:DNA-binding SARP family transcriptional activator n=1 Tax=Stackebrandtia endophytica TaxID=1496996 RepID=A0A543B113_9ACTN|nr:BTAD domain-containing putative transcriptional regulator [Stackebrandtia endophytica]TQL78486.1 DNA-binding SARP family transcriptional activator [Stackebrandtia endophytica]
MLIRLIGSVRADIDGRVHRITAPKLACVLAALAVQPGNPVEIPELISRVWGHQPPETAVGILYNYTARLRAVLRDTDRVHIRKTRSSGYLLDTDPNHIDLHRIRALTARADREAERGDLAAALQSWREANDLARGEALLGIHGRWAEDQRSLLRTEQLKLWTNLYGAELALGHHDTVINELTQIVARQPLAEPLVKHLMLAQYRCGQAAAALESFETVKRQLRDHLNAYPSPQLQHLHQLILNHDPELTAPINVARSIQPQPVRPIPAQLPADTIGFTGRDADAEQLFTAVTNHPVIAIDGMAGVGKTALALHAAHRLASEFPDGQLFLDLRAYTHNVSPLASDTALAQLLRSVGAEVPDNKKERTAAWRTETSERKMLLVLDNANSAEQLHPLVPNGSGCLTIITSRRRLVNLPEARHISLHPLSPAQSARIFAMEAGLPEGQPGVDDIASVCGHLPLALRIAASRLRNRPSWTPEDLLSRLTGGQAPLRELDGTGHGLMAAFELSYRGLDATARSLFRRLSIFPASSDIDKFVAAVLAGASLDSADMALKQLLDDHMLQAFAPGRYRMHDLLRDYAAALMTDSAERDAAWLRLADRYVRQAWRALEFITPHSRDWARLVSPADSHLSMIDSLSDAEAWFPRHLGVLENLTQQAFRSGLDEYVIDLCIPIQGYLLRQGGGSDIRLPFAEMGVSAARRLNDLTAEARLTNYLGIYHSDLGDIRTSTPHFQRAVTLWREIGNSAGEVAALNNIANIEANSGMANAALPLYQTAIDISSREGLTSQEIHIRITAAGQYYKLERLGDASFHLDKAERLIDPVRHRRQLVRLWFQRGSILCESGDLAAAERLFNQVVEYARENQVPDMLISGQWGTAQVCLQRGDYSAALTSAQQQLEALERWYLPYLKCRALIQLSRAQVGLGDFDSSIDCLRNAIAISDRIGARRASAQARESLAELLLKRDISESLKLLASAQQLYAAGGYPQQTRIERRLSELSLNDPHVTPATGKEKPCSFES